ncbi:(2Fe-2S) ferredoxin domain-containing protein [Chitinimonas arctica]|uniref:(2Fe-2S) ferredoxin domain-containing protein n=1 Tax=Chitinimonas arctica TaxID=2594795 RepID=A0A516SLA8_9NEIS|nr:(2Fe-2S) ferredoxin domain-containing protein [Chitinimonas arctica]QDQ28942.1 (2Fe-2S) ferredoxin domain-containing protein [Chitinimonas arctica]
MSYFKHHVFFCTNQRPNGESCCADFGANEVHAYAKKRVKELGLAGEGKIRTNKAGCLDRCAQGPVLVVYPDNVWYQYVDQDDVEEIIQEHLVNGREVARLKI